jgi:hypothetical protein
VEVTEIAAGIPLLSIFIIVAVSGNMIRTLSRRLNVINYSKKVKKHCPAGSVSAFQPSFCFALVLSGSGFY